MLRDIQRGKDPQVLAIITEITSTAPDILVVQGFDYDLESAALKAFAAQLADAGSDFPYHFAATPNAGDHTTLDLDGDGKLGGAGDAQGYGRFFGQGSMAVLSRFPIDKDNVENHADLLWRDMPGALLPETDAGPFPSAAALAVQRLSSHGHWIVPVMHPEFGAVHIMTYHATPPVFDGPEDRNGRRNHDETAFWSLYLDGRLGNVPNDAFVLMGDANLDPMRGDGRGMAMRALLAHKSLQDPLGAEPTVNWARTGPMRVDYILPSHDWQVINSGIRPSNPDASRHSLIWVDLTR